MILCECKWRSGQPFAGGRRFAAPEELPVGGCQSQVGAAGVRSVGWDGHAAEGYDLTSAGLG